MQECVLSAQAVGGPTVLLRYGGLTLLTDPSFDAPGEYPRGPYEPLRKTAGPAVVLADLGAIDVVLLSHDHHSDNLDTAGRAMLPQANKVITTLAGAERLDIGATGLEPWQSTEIVRPDGSTLTVTAVPAQHGPDGTDHLTGPVIGFVLQSPGLPSVYVSGDNASVAIVETIVERLGSFEIAVLFVGAARLVPFDDYLTLSAERAATVTRILGAEAVIPTHFDGWTHFSEGFQQLEAAFAQAGLADKLLPALPGTTVYVPDTIGRRTHLNIAVLGASGWLGGEIAREALARGHAVTAIGRDRERLDAVRATRTVQLDIRDRNALALAIADHDAVVIAISDRSTDDRSIIPQTTQLLIELTQFNGPQRLAFVGGGGSLTLDDGTAIVDLPDFPEQYRAEALAQGESLQILRDSISAIDWTYLSPPPEHLEPGPKASDYRVQADEHPVTDTNGDSRISTGDLAAAMLDELEHPKFTRQRFTVGY